MKFIRQPHSIKVKNFDHVIKMQSDARRHGNLLPNTIRCIVAGPSNSGKTNLLFNLLFDPNGLRFNNLYVFSKSLQQPKYRLLEQVLKGVPQIGYYPFNENEQVVDPNEAKPMSIFVFDDVACECQNNIRSYFTMGRHNNIDVFYLAQTYSRIPKQLVRDNANMIVLFKQDDMNLRHVYNDHVNTDMTYDTFRNACAKAWNDRQYGFLVIDKDRELNDGRYRLGFDTFIDFSINSGT